jgi:hypothetical protein
MAHMALMAHVSPKKTYRKTKKGAPACPGVPWGLAFETWVLLVDAHQVPCYNLRFKQTKSRETQTIIGQIRLIHRREVSRHLFSATIHLRHRIPECAYRKTSDTSEKSIADPCRN